MIEGMICGAIPITCSDNLTAKEFSPPEFICKPTAENMVKKIEDLNNAVCSILFIDLLYWIFHLFPTQRRFVPPRIFF